MYWSTKTEYVRSDTIAWINKTVQLKNSEINETYWKRCEVKNEICFWAIKSWIAKSGGDRIMENLKKLANTVVSSGKMP